MNCIDTTTTENILMGIVLGMQKQEKNLIIK
jgi:hypothetical protein